MAEYLSPEDVILHKSKKKFYRFMDGTIFNSKITIGDVVFSSDVTIFDQVLYLIKETPCGYWIYDDWVYKKRWVSGTSTRRFAYPTREEALVSYKFRKVSQLKILKNRLGHCELFLKQAYKELGELLPQPKKRMHLG